MFIRFLKISNIFSWFKQSPDGKKTLELRKAKIYVKILPDIIVILYIRMFLVTRYARYAIYSSD